MKDFKSFFTFNEVLKYICKFRIKISDSRAKKQLLHNLTSQPKYNYHLPHNPRNTFEQYQHDLELNLKQILPPRKKWVKLGNNNRIKKGTSKEKLTTFDKNFNSLLKTVSKHQQSNSKESWFLHLNSFINDVIETALDPNYSVSKPVIIPKLKHTKVSPSYNECRPLCLFNIKDRIILSITNRYLTELFDPYFEDNSYAFRLKKNKDGQTFSHHDCVRELRNYRMERLNRKLYVIECDMKKFYDTVNHSILREMFTVLIDKVQKDNPHLSLESGINIFNSYLDCYNFKENVLNSTTSEYWNSYKIPNGEFSWITDSLHEYYTNSLETPLGVPQGGALSGLIANIYLDYADKKLSEHNVFYLRFCDDMIVITETLNDCIEAKKEYFNALLKLKLFPHKFKEDIELITFKDNDTINYKPFWDGKSKGPYQWGKPEDLCFPWIGFVGYEINYKGEVRVRKRSLEKELLKQKKVISDIKNAINSSPRKSKNTIIESTINKLIGMSVGRVSMYNKDNPPSDLCWKNGFRELTMNPHSKQQIKYLDRHRNKLFYKFSDSIPKIKLDIKKVKKRELYRYDKPFSYYFHILENRK